MLSAKANRIVVIVFLAAVGLFGLYMAVDIGRYYLAEPPPPPDPRLGDWVEVSEEEIYNDDDIAISCRYRGGKYVYIGPVGRPQGTDLPSRVRVTAEIMSEDGTVLKTLEDMSAIQNGYGSEEKKEYGKLDITLHRNDYRYRVNESSKLLDALTEGDRVTIHMRGSTAIPGLTKGQIMAGTWEREKVTGLSHALTLLNCKNLY